MSASDRFILKPLTLMTWQIHVFSAFYHFFIAYLISSKHFYLNMQGQCDCGFASFFLNSSEEIQFGCVLPSELEGPDRLQ